VYKIFANILYQRLLPYAEETVGEYKCGFRTERSTIDQLFSIRQILEKCTEFNIDFRAAYESVRRQALWEIMEEFGFPQKLISLTKLTLRQVKSMVRINQKLSEPFETLEGLRQGDPLATLQFNIALEKATRGINADNSKSIYTRSTQILAYADDLDLVGRNIAAVKDAFESLEKGAEAVGLRINTDKTKYMVATKKGAGGVQNLIVDDHSIEAVDSFVYVGSTINSKNNVALEVKQRIRLGNKCYFSLQKLMSKRSSRHLKCTLYKSLIRPVVTYGAETWCITTKEEQLLLLFERKILRKIFGPVQVNGVWRRRYNFELQGMLNEPDILRFIKVSRLRWFGHVQRMDDNRIPKKLWREKPDGKRNTGRPKSRWADKVEDDLRKLAVVGGGPEWLERHATGGQNPQWVVEPCRRRRLHIFQLTLLYSINTHKSFKKHRLPGE
jgi:sorting nexin-29